MPIQELLAQTIVLDHHHRQSERGSYPEDLHRVLSPERMAAAKTEIARWPGYEPTPLRALDRLAGDLKLGQVYYKDESPRFGLGSFKALGGSYAVLCLLAREIEKQTGATPSLEEIRRGDHKDRVASITVITATDGNHGRSVAWGAQMAGCRCRIYIHQHVSEGRQKAMEALGAEVIRVDGDYDHSLEVCAREAEENGWFVVSDTSYEGYMDLPRYVMAGYSVMADEIIDQLEGEPPTHVFIQAGVGGVAAAVLARFWSEWGEKRPRFVIVEPGRAACVLESARRDKPMSVAIAEETVMAGLSCGEVSLLAWEILSRGAEDFLAIGESAVGPAMRLLAAGEAGGGEIEAGESAVPGVAALAGACEEGLGETLGLTAESRVLLFGCEGATDPAIYKAILEGKEAAA